MTDEEFKRHLYKQLEEDKKNQRILTHQLYKKQSPQKRTPKNNQKSS